MASFSKIRSDIEGDLEDQIARLSKELSSLKKSLSKRGAVAYEDTRESASELYSDVWDRVQDALPVVRKRAREAEKLAKDNPATAAAVGLVIVGLVLTLLARR